MQANRDTTSYESGSEVPLPLLVKSQSQNPSLSPKNEVGPTITWDTSGMEADEIAEVIDQTYRLCDRLKSIRNSGFRKR